MGQTRLFYCRTLESEIMAAAGYTAPDSLVAGLEYALHNVPKKLCQELQGMIDATEEDCDLILLGYGLCSNGVDGLLSARHTIVIPRVHDCISLLLGSRAEYYREFRANPGTSYLSKGWISQGGDPLTSYRNYCQRYGEKKARMFMEMEYANYKRLAYIHTVGDDGDDVRYGREVADFLKLEFVELQGSLKYFEKLIGREWDDDFIVNPPGKPLAQQLFF
jgi:hypothetical protein